ncbi:hypothetical protein CF70_013065 [Cupriavidus sp. SK-3]|uniref:hypothetical protein n=1 Tax=Cupriavidus sp. SK-3 TaxID=1470558 RepID=UPI000445ADAC|nr:hypothetical protein [Cupriavidus sp. SK-3]KDP85621.1 hypothetical protein CF70_013065 [Cupriavidus sp. SK-3]
MPALKLNEAELSALSGMDYAAICMYVMAIRPRMDFRTGAVGLAPRISWQALKEWLYIEPRPGVKATIPSIEAIRRMALQLVKNGLLRIGSREKQLIFFCPLAMTDKNVQKKADSKPTGQSDRQADNSQGNTGAGFREEADREADIPENAKADTHPSTGKTLNPPPPTPPALRAGGEYQQPPTPTAREGEIDPQDHRDARTHRLSEQRHEGTGSVGEGASRRLARDGGSIAWADRLHWPVDIAQARRAAIAKNLDGLDPDLSQTVLDEWRGCMEAGGIRAPYKFLASLVDKARAGDWIPDHADRIREQREAARAAAEAAANRESAFAAEVAASRAGKPAGRLADLVRPRNAKGASHA